MECIGKADVYFTNAGSEIGSGYEGAAAPHQPTETEIIHGSRSSVHFICKILLAG